MVPQTIAAARDIYDAQRSRGHQFRSLGDARGLVVPLLGTGLERAVALSEALEARGFGASAAQGANDDRRWRFALAGAVALMAAALPLLAQGRLTLGLLSLAGAAGLALAGSPGHSRRSRYRALAWNMASLSVAAAGLAVPLALLALALAGGAALAYDPFPRLVMPAFQPLAGAAILLLLAPILWDQP
jgi:energy-coupling factor transport system permease protein